MSFSKLLSQSVSINNRRKSLRLSVCALIVAATLPTVGYSQTAQTTQTIPANQTAKITERKPLIIPQNRPKIQVAILLDTSGSMDGLIDQTRNQLWQVVNEFSTAKQNGQTPVLEVALFEYGNDGNPQAKGYVRKLNNFTRELDSVSEGLFSLTTNGGNEFCGFAIKTAVEQLQWSKAANDIKTIFIAGNEPFTQGPVNYQQAIKLAKQQGITVNTIFAGDHSNGVATGWHNGATLAGGDFMSINANQKVVHIDAPQDAKIAELNAKLNQTYIPYGSQGAAKAQRQMEQDTASISISGSLLAKRAKSKSSSYYKNSSWDLVDAVEEGEVDAQAFADMDTESLPEPMQTMSLEERKEYVEIKAKERQAIKQAIAELSDKRDVYVAEKRKEAALTAPTMSDALTQAVIKQAKSKNFKFEK